MVTLMEQVIKTGGNKLKGIDGLSVKEAWLEYM